MAVQTVLVALIVAACVVYAAWALMPAAGRRGIAGALTKLPLPEGLARRLARAAKAPGGCGCDGCDAPAPPGTAAVKPVTFHPRHRR